MFRVTEMFACRINSCTTFTSSPFPLRSVAYVCRNVCQPKWPAIPISFAAGSKWRFVERTWPVWQFASAVRTGEYPVLIGWVRTMQPPVPQSLRQSQVERNRLARGFGLAVPDVLHHDRADDMDFHLLKIDVLPLEA